MANSYFQFKAFTIHQDKCAMKVTTDGCLFGAWLTEEMGNLEPGISGTGITNRSVLDIGTGTGLLSLMLAQKNARLMIDALEIDADAAQQAMENVAASPWKERIHVIEGDVRTFPFDKKYDCIISNPPFYENELSSPDQRKNIAHHSGELVLQDVVTIIKENLAHGGWFFLLLPYKRNADVRDGLIRNGLSISRMIFVRQSVKHDYFRIMLMGQAVHGYGAETIIDELSVMDDADRYTPEFIQLLQPYYLRL